MALFRSYGHTPKWVFIFIGLCVAIFFAEYMLPIFDLFSFIPVLAFEQPWRFVTSIFLHAGIEHIFFNMFALFVFGMYLESNIGSKRFILIFFLSGIAGNLAYMLLSPYGTIPAVGASGAIYGVMGMLAVMRPTLIVYVGYIPMPMVIAAIVWTLMEFMGLFVPGNIAHEAHLAGLFVGGLYGFISRKRKKEELMVVRY